MNEVVIVSAVRTPIASIRGALSSVRPDDLAAIVIRESVARADIDPAEVEEVIFGCANQAGEDNRNVARMGLLLAGLPHGVAGSTINRLCASGLAAINQAARAIRAGEGDIYIAGGVESMTRAPYVMAKNPSAFGPSGNKTAFDTTLGWRFPNSAMEKLFPLEPMGETAENIYELSREGKIKGGEISREQQDAYALQSQARAVHAMQAGYFKREIVPVSIWQHKGEAKLFDTDEYVRANATQNGLELATNLEQLSLLKPAFHKDGSVLCLERGTIALALHFETRKEERIKLNAYQIRENIAPGKLTSSTNCSR